MSLSPLAARGLPRLRAPFDFGAGAPTPRANGVPCDEVQAMVRRAVAFPPIPLLPVRPERRRAAPKAKKAQRGKVEELPRSRRHAAYRIHEIAREALHVEQPALGPPPHQLLAHRRQ